MTTQNRYYSMTAQATQLTNPSGINATETDVEVGSATNFPSSFPFVLIIEPDTTNMEAVLVSSGAGTASNPFQVTRGYDNTTQRGHNTGVPVVHGFVELDFAEPQQHLNTTADTSSVHGLPKMAWHGGSMQTIQAQTLSSPGSFNFTVPSTPYNHLRLLLTACSAATGGNGFDNICLQFNGDTGADYSTHGIYEVDSTTVSGTSANVTTSALAGAVPNGNFAPAGNDLASSVVIDIPFSGVANLSKGGNFVAHGSSGVGSPNNASFNIGGFIWGNNKPAISSLLIFPQTSPNNFTTGSMATLYGII